MGNKEINKFLTTLASLLHISGLKKRVASKDKAFDRVTIGTNIGQKAGALAVKTAQNKISVIRSTIYSTITDRG